MQYQYSAISESAVPRAASPLFQHLLDTYASETNKIISTWSQFAPDQLGYRPHPRSSSVQEIFKHELLSQRRFFDEFIGTPEPSAGEILPARIEPAQCGAVLAEMVLQRLQFLASQTQEWWLQPVKFFDVERERIWVFWRRILHSAHHRTQLTVYLRLLDQKVPSCYGPTADVTWTGADPTATAQRPS